MLVGRERERFLLEGCYNSGKSEFVSVYGRRRVGKTFLIKELFGEIFTFYTTGILDGTREEQLEVWNKDMLRFGGQGLNTAESWLDAFDNLNKLVEQSPDGRKVIFLDEIPWMATMHSGFLAGLDYFWNRWASSRKDVLLIVCGSAASWITDNIVNNKGGLHNRLTRQILLEPFTLKECEQYLESCKIPMTRHQIAEAYMIFGGIPYYFSLMKPQFSLYQNVDELYFREDAALFNEFDNLYHSLYTNANNHIRIVEALAKKGIGMTRGEIAESAKLSNGGSLTRTLQELITSGFIRKYKAYGQKKRDSLYQLVDFFTLFDVRFRGKRDEYTSDYWLQFSSTSAHSIWSGFSFEKLCLLHLRQIRKRLGIAGMMTSAFSWKGDYSEVGEQNKGAQIDLVIDRSDNVINLCEMKFASGKYKIDKEYSESLRNKRTAFTYSTRTRKVAQTTMITTFGLARNMYSDEIVSEVLLDDLFE